MHQKRWVFRFCACVSPGLNFETTVQNIFKSYEIKIFLGLKHLNSRTTVKYALIMLMSRKLNRMSYVAFDMSKQNEGNKLTHYWNASKSLRHCC